MWSSLNSSKNMMGLLCFNHLHVFLCVLFKKIKFSVAALLQPRLAEEDRLHPCSKMRALRFSIKLLH